MDKSIINDLYTERSMLVCILAAMYPSVIARPSDAEEGFNWAVYIESPYGQLSWHIADDDIDKFMLICPIEDEDVWDGATKDDVIYRMGRLAGYLYVERKNGDDA